MIKKKKIICSWSNVVIDWSYRILFLGLDMWFVYILISTRISEIIILYAINTNAAFLNLAYCSNRAIRQNTRWYNTVIRDKNSYTSKFLDAERYFYFYLNVHILDFCPDIHVLIAMCVAGRYIICLHNVDKSYTFIIFSIHHVTLIDT